IPNSSIGAPYRMPMRTVAVIEPVVPPMIHRVSHQVSLIVPLTGIAYSYPIADTGAVKLIRMTAPDLSLNWKLRIVAVRVRSPLTAVTCRTAYTFRVAATLPTWTLVLFSVALTLLLVRIVPGINGCPRPRADTS